VSTKTAEELTALAHLMNATPQICGVRGGAKVGHWSGGDLRLRAA
jgi:predicted transcriptional regulator